MKIFSNLKKTSKMIKPIHEKRKITLKDKIRAWAFYVGLAATLIGGTVCFTVAIKWLLS